MSSTDQPRCGAGGRQRPGRRRRSGCPSPAPPAASSPSRCRRTRPPPTAVADAPLPRCSTTRLVSSTGAAEAARRRVRDDEGVRGAVEAVAPDPVLLAPARRHRVGVGGSAASSGGRRCRTPRRAARRGTAAGRPRCPSRLAGLWSGASGDQLLDGGEHLVVDQRRLGEPRRRRARPGARPRPASSVVDRGPVRGEGVEQRRRAPSSRSRTRTSRSCVLGRRRPRGRASRAPRRSARRARTRSAVAAMSPSTRLYFRRRRAGVERPARAGGHQAALVATSCSLRLDRGDRHGVDDVAHGRPARQVVDRLAQPLQDRADRERAGRLRCTAL